MTWLGDLESRPRRDTCLAPWYVAPGSTSIAAEYVGVTLPNASRRLTAPSLLPSDSAPSLRYWIGLFAILILVCGFAGWRPHQNGPAALALGAALVFDIGARLFGAAATRRSGLAGQKLALPSLVLLVGNPLGVALVGIVGILTLSADRLPLLASLLAGIVAIAAVARLAAAYSLLAAKNEADEE